MVGDGIVAALLDVLLEGMVSFHNLSKMCVRKGMSLVFTGTLISILGFRFDFSWEQIF